MSFSFTHMSNIWIFVVTCVCLACQLDICFHSNVVEILSFENTVCVSEIKDHKEQVQCVFSVIEKLPKPNYDLFERLTFHLTK